MAETKAPVERPLSPHLQIYKPMLTMTMSIVASHHRRRALFRHAAAGLVADRGGVGPERLRDVRVVHRLDHRPAHPVRLHLGADPSHARRHPPSDLGHRPRLRPERARMARRRQPGRLDLLTIVLCGSSAICAWEGRVMDIGKHDPHAARPRPRPRLRQVRHRAFLAPAPDRGRQRAADHRRRHHRGHRCSAATTRRSRRSSARRWSPSSCCCSSSRSPTTCASACR